MGLKLFLYGLQAHFKRLERRKALKTESNFMKCFSIINQVLLKAETFLLALITLGLVAAIFIEVVCRYFLFISVAWAEELTRYLFIWLTYIGSAYACYECSHTEIDIFEQILKKNKDPQKRAKSLRGLSLVSYAATGAFLIYFSKIFFDYMMKIWKTTQTSPTMHIPMGLVYLPVFVGLVLCAFHEIFLFTRELSSGKATVPAEAEE